ncbi:hypothetical protein [Cryobacterium sp. Hb1]|uniref:hypothetical protein n=1 Tax=Cryobacterium sp. Hb1 TaxID=1259147 RepID=UPI00106C1FA1|nr:hypothetical protein [Cryobacterium sp. Hb1]TFD72148.1 hypothetical protein E3T38_01240 [Cryobacterium sp. Hb1]
MSTCNNCGAHGTIRSHLIPRAFCVEVQDGPTHAAGVTNAHTFEKTQSGLIDRTILCHKCDGVLGDYENYALKFFRKFREETPRKVGELVPVPDADIPKLLRFCAGILYKYSLTTPEHGRIRLGAYQHALREFLYNEQRGIPLGLGLFVLRPMRFDGDQGVWAYRAPKDDRQEGLNLYRMMMGGVILFVYLDKQIAQRKPEAPNFVSADSSLFSIATVSAFDFEEYTKPQELAFEEGKLSDYLDALEDKKLKTNQ